MVTILMVSTIMATVGLIKVNIFWNKADDVVIFVSGITNKILSSNSNHNLCVFMWPKFGNFSAREVIIISIL